MRRRQAQQDALTNPDMEFTPEETAAMGGPAPVPALEPAGPEKLVMFDKFIGDAARTDLDYQPSPPAQVRKALPQTAASREVSAPEDMIGAKPRPWWAMGLRTLPRAIAGAALAPRAKSQAGVDAIRGLGQQNSQIVDEHFRDQDNYQNKAAALARKRKAQEALDAKGAEKAALEASERQRRHGIEDKRLTIEEQRAAREAAKHDPDSDVNKRARELNTAGEESELDRAKRLAQYRNSLPYKGPRVIGGGGFSAEGSEEVTTEATMGALAEQYGGEDKIPPALKQRVKIAGAIKNPAKRGAALTAALDKGQVREEDGSKAEEKLVVEYTKQRKALGSYASSLEDLVGELDKRGAGLDSGKDIPGIGPVENIEAGGLADWFRSPDAQIVRGKTKNLLGERVKELTGLASTDAERRRIDDIAGMNPGQSEQVFRENIRWLRDFTRRRINELDATLKGPAEETFKNRTIAAPMAEAQLPSSGGAQRPPVGQAQGPAPAQRLPPSKPGMMRIRNRKTGKIADGPQGPVPEGWDQI